MASELKIFSGKCMYRGIDFTFIFDCKELRLIPPEDKRDTIRMEWIMTRVDFPRTHFIVLSSFSKVQSLQI